MNDSALLFLFIVVQVVAVQEQTLPGRNAGVIGRGRYSETRFEELKLSDIYLSRCFVHPLFLCTLDIENLSKQRPSFHYICVIFEGIR